MYTREEFEQVRRTSAEAMAQDAELQRDALDLLVRADRHNWIHQSTWFGEPALQIAQDLFAFQEIIFATRPRFIVEIGVAWGGSMLFFASLMHALGAGRVIGVDIYVPNDLRERVGRFGQVSDRISWISGSSVEDDTFRQVSEIIGETRDVLVLLDSHHTHEHVLRELQLYSPLVGKGHYMICGDTIVEKLPVQTHRARAWGPGDNPRTAVDEFLRETDRFEVDPAIENKLLFTCNPGGYLRCVRD